MSVRQMSRDNESNPFGWFMYRNDKYEEKCYNGKTSYGKCGDYETDPNITIDDIKHSFSMLVAVSGVKF